jgi:DNA-directed RNA polymerase subunit RPC12/RpoP
MQDKQQKFYECPECSAIVERVYQNGVCKSCLSKKFQTVRLVIDRNHALQDAPAKVGRAARVSSR